MTEAASAQFVSHVGYDIPRHIDYPEQGVQVASEIESDDVELPYDDGQGVDLEPQPSEPERPDKEVPAPRNDTELQAEASAEVSTPKKAPAKKAPAKKAAARSKGK